MTSQSQSRLHRLLTLLDTGSTQATRFAAARQIGEIAKAHPQELNYLLKKISPFLHNKKWETRVAAAHAIGAVAESVKLVSLFHIHSQLDAQMQQSEISISFAEAVPYPNFHPDFFSGLLFRSFDIIRVLGFGALLASGGQEYDVVSDSTKDPKERLFIQKRNLRHRLGLDVCEQFMDLNDMITDEDILAHKVASHDNGLKSNLQAKNVQQLVLTTFPRFTSKRPSVRELNLLKRKAKINSKEQGKGWSEDESSFNKASKTSKNIGLSNSSKASVGVASGNNSEFGISEQWPFQNFVEQLLLDIFNPIWEVRHGSAMALREIFTFQGSSAGVYLSDCDADVLLTENKQNKLCKESTENDVTLDDQHSLDSFEPGPKRQKLLRSTSTLQLKASNIGSCEIPKHGMHIELEVTEQSSPTRTDCEVISVQSLNAGYESHDINGVSISEGSQAEPKSFPFKDVPDEELHHDRVISSSDLSAVLEEKSDLKNLLEMARFCWLRNCEVLQDCAVRLLCVLVLDRFGDYVSDQVVAPVRETSAQALGAVLKHMHPGLVIEVLNILLQMQHRPEWEIRHGSLLGIKYLVAVRKEMISDLIGHVLPACKSGLEDPDDDVRAVAADALIPAASAVVSLQNQTFYCIVMLLWDILLDLDDLSPSTSSVMNLLAEIYSQEELDSTVLSTSFMTGGCHINLTEAIPTDDQCERENSASHPSLLVTLAPRLWPFMRHNIRSVRYSAIRTLERLLEAVQRSTAIISLSSSWPKEILGDTLRIVFQNLLLESSNEILRCSERVWRLLLQSSETDLQDAACSFYSSWVDLAATPYGSSIDAFKMFWPASLPRKNNLRAAKVRAVRRDRDHTAADSLETNENIPLEQNGNTLTNVSKIVVGTDTEKNVTHTRVVTAGALGVLASRLPATYLESVFSILLRGLISLSGVQRQVACMVLISWFKEKKPGFFCDKSASAHMKDIKNSIINLLSCTDPSFPSIRTTLPYTELSRTYSKMRLEASQLLHACESCGIFRNSLSTIKIDLEKLTVEGAINFASKLTEENVDSPGELSVSNLILNDLDPVKQRLLTTAGYLMCVQNNLHVSVTTLMAAALVWMSELPAKLNPVILPLMASIKREQEEVLQLQAADALSELICCCIARGPSPNDKLIRNIFGLICSDPCETPQAETLSSMELIEDQDILCFGSTTGDQKAKSTSLSSSQVHSTLDGFIGRRGSELLLKHLCEKLGASLFEKVPKIWDCLIAVLIPANHESLKSEDEMQLLVSLESVRDPQALINNIQIVRCVVTMVHESPRERVMLLLPCIIQCVQHSHLAIRLAASRCVTSIAKLTASSVMPIIIQKVIPMLRDSGSACARHGAGVLVNLLVRELGVVLVPYALLLVVPLLRCMGDCSHSVRQTVTHSFAALVPLLPLGRGIPLPLGINGDLLRDADDVKFLEQLLDNSNIDDYNLPIELKVTLRRYQQEGINWLAFLRRFKLHGILCDDMGLGKTLQASAIVATDIVERRGDDKERPMSLIVCPSTLVGHWAYEIEKFIDGSVINAMQYVGSSQERVNAREHLRDHNVVITSYDVVRKDIDYLAKVLWTYCILDEGHIIKNSKSKVTRAMKELRAHHRLILTGTPIQNNILDLWSLFDFLMPGFLGSERQFQAMYGKPLLAARDPKCSARDAEAGALAMEALHKQVMPFLLRRTKEDVLSDLPEKIIQDRYCSLSPVQLKLYEQFSGSHVRKEISTMVEKHEPAEGTNAPRASSHVFQAMQYLLKLCSHPLLVVAADALDSFGAVFSELIPNASDVLSAFRELHHAPKLVALKEILEECGIGVEAVCVGQHRVLIFAQHKAFLDIIERDLFHTHMKSVTYLRMDGSVETQKRFEIVKAFNSDPTIDVLLLTTHVGGLGLNLTSADTLVFMEHDWNPMRDLQAMDRAHRLGQRKVVNVHRLIMRGTLEEKVMSLQKFKLSVANSVVNSENASLKTMNTDQLLDLFTPAKSLNKGDGGKEEEGTSSSSTNGGKRGLKAILNGLEELWDHSQYTEEYNLDHFLSKLNA